VETLQKKRGKIQGGKKTLPAVQEEKEKFWKIEQVGGCGKNGRDEKGKKAAHGAPKRKGLQHGNL